MQRREDSERDFIDHSEQFESEAETLLGSLARAAEAVEGLHHVLREDPLAVSQPVPGTEDRIRHVEILVDSERFSVYFEIVGAHVRLLSIQPVRFETLG